MTLTQDEVKLVNCAGCQVLLLGESMAPFFLLQQARSPFPLEYRHTPIMAGRVDGRPYCKTCLVDQKGKDS